MLELLVIATVMSSPAITTADLALPPSPTASAPATQSALPAQNAGQPVAVVGNASAPPLKSQDTSVNANAIVCHLTPATSGTRFGAGKVCRTALEWKQIEAESQQAVRHAQRIGLDDRVIGH
jgi:hypothetical protein